MLLGARQLMSGGAAAWTNPYITDGLVAMWDAEWNAGGGKHDATIVKAVNLADSDIGDLSLPSDIWQIGDMEISKISSGNLQVSYPSKAWYEENFLSGDGYAVEIVCNVNKSTSTYEGVVSIGQGCGIIFNGGDLYGITTINSFEGIGEASGNIWIRPYTNDQMIRYHSISVDPSVITTGRFGEKIINSDSGKGGIVGTQYYNYGRNVISIGVLYSRLYAQDVGWKLCSVRIYNRYLNTDETAANYAVDKSRFGLP